MTTRDPGLQPERTQLAWRRTGWSMLIPGLLCLRGWRHGGDLFYATSGIMLVLGALLLLCTLQRKRHSAVSLCVVIAGSLLLLKTSLGLFSLF